MTDKPVRVRIAPSPTGYLHVGTARAALFNYLYARHTGGKFLVRIEDTDKERSKTEFIEPILDGLRWLGLNWDEELVFQSQRQDRYAEALSQFLETDHAYYCFCSKELLHEKRQAAVAEKRSTRYDRTCLALSNDDIQARIDAGEKPVVRLKIPEGDIKYVDSLAGELTRNSNDIEDFVVARSDGSVTYNFAVVVDDHDMAISHVMRGNDHITNTFKQVVLYDALGYDLPVFCHLPLILRPDKKKVSKRLGDKNIGEYRHEGILPEAMVNYLSLLGWSPKTDNEIYTLSELIDLFELDNLNASNAVFDIDKLAAFNKAHIQKMSDHDLATMVAPLLVDAGHTTKYWLETRWEYLRQVVRMLQPRLQFIGDFVDQGSYFFSFDGKYDPDAAAKNFNPEAAELLTALVAAYDALDTFTEADLETALTAVAEAKDVKKGKVIHPTRLAVSGVSKGPGLYEMLAALGKPIVIERLNQAIEYIKQARQET